MSNFKTKAKNFWENHKTEIIVVGGVAVAAIGAGVWAYKSYMSGFTYGLYRGFQATLDWLDENFPEESHARELWETYEKNNPDNVVYVNYLGKVVK